MKKNNISEINLDLVFQCNDFSQFSNKLRDTKSKLIFYSFFWEKVFFEVVYDSFLFSKGFIFFCIDV